MVLAALYSHLILASRNLSLGTPVRWIYFADQLQDPVLLFLEALV